jgi:hypothetical protein
MNGDRTLYLAQAAHGYSVVFDTPQRLVRVVGDGTFWVRRRSPLDGPGTPPSSQPGPAGTVVTGWLRVWDGVQVEYGRPRTEPAYLVPAERRGIAESMPESQRETNHLPLSEQISGLDVWAETTGSIVVWSEGVSS